jgi:hypothetical protein
MNTPSNYGLPYKGSKSKLAERIVGIFPRATHFYDLFSGGCAISHCALLRNKFEHIHINDINPMMPEAFIKALNGDFENETRWISRDDFFKLKDTDPYVAICFSFGNDLKTYCYGPDVEPIKKALHYALCFDTFELSDQYIGVDLRAIRYCNNMADKYLLAKRIIKNAFIHNPPPYARKLSKTQTHTGYKVTSDCTEFGARRSKKNSIQLQSYISLRRIQSTGGGQYGKSNLTWSIGDYSNVDINEDSVIYADIPYLNTNKYVGKGENFDYERFYNWCLNQKQPLFISSYEMPEKDFKIVAEFARNDSMSAKSVKLVAERLFIPRTQEIRGNIQLSLF